MLHYQAIDKPTLELLKQLQSIELFKDLRLVGGTSLALQIGYRKSVDISLSFVRGLGVRLRTI